MNTFFRKNLILFSLCLLSGCQQSDSDKQAGIPSIDVINNLGNYQNIPLSEFVSEVEYIPLETNDDCLMGGISCLLVTPTHIFIESFIASDYIISAESKTRCYAFSRNGRFIGEIGRVGQGPGEYQRIVDLTIDEKKQLLYIETPITLLEYTYDGVFRRSIRKPKSMNEQPISEVAFLNDNLFIGHCANHIGNEPYNFFLFNDSGRVIKTFNNYIKFERISGSGWSIGEKSIRPFRVSESIYVKVYANDTLYFLNEQNELTPRFVFDLGKYSVQEKRGGPINSLSDFYIPNVLKHMVGTPDYIFFSVSTSLSANIPHPKGRIVIGQDGREEQGLQIPLGIYDMANNKTRLLETDPVSRLTGLINDIDGGFSFWPKYYSSANELIDVLQVYAMKEILTEKYFAAHEIKDPQAHQKLKELLKNLEFDDNPVIVIAKLKK